MAQDMHPEDKAEILSTGSPDEIDGSDLGDDEIAPGEIQTKTKPAIEIFEFLEMLILAACVIMLIFSFVARICTVDGPSMNNTLTHGDKLIVSNLFYTPSQGDIVVFQDLDLRDDKTGKPLYENAIIKRVIATAGQTVVLNYETQGDLYIVTVTIDGVPLEEPYRYYDASSSPSKIDGITSKTETYIVPEGCLFVMGDNTYHSEDSRGRFGYVETSKVLGRAIFRLGGKDLSSLFSKFGFIE
ncbi:MAG: signal peptidase I [Clostridia bacterium]|nr:signal peptidase I [Clostridia bacterium]